MSDTICKTCGDDKSRYDFDPQGCVCEKPSKEIWTGKRCPHCSGHGVRKDVDSEERGCPDCAGTGDEYGSAFPKGFFDDQFEEARDDDSALQAAAREAGWALSSLMDEIKFEKRQHVVNIINRLSAALAYTHRPLQREEGS